MNQYCIASHIGVWSTVQASRMERNADHVDFYVGNTMTATFHKPVSVQLIATVGESEGVKKLLSTA